MTLVRIAAQAQESESVLDFVLPGNEKAIGRLYQT